MNLIWNREEGRPKAGWRLLGAVLLWSVLVPVSSAVLPAMIALGLLLSGRLPSGPAIPSLTAAVNQALNSSVPLFALQELMPVLGAVVFLWLAGKLLDRRPLRAFGLHFDRRWWADFGFGLALGAALLALIFLIELWAGWVTVTGLRRHSYPIFWVPMAVGVIRFLAVAVQEELPMRGYLLRNLGEGLNSKRWGGRAAVLAAWLGSSILFGLLHRGNPNATWMSTFNVMVGGLMLGIGYILTGQLGLSIGLHISWNYCMGYVFGFPVSGGGMSTSFFAIQQGGPQWLTGGAFGPEGGLIGLAAFVVGLLLAAGWVRWTRGRTRINEELAEYRQNPDPVIQTELAAAE